MSGEPVPEDDRPLPAASTEAVEPADLAKKKRGRPMGSSNFAQDGPKAKTAKQAEQLTIAHDKQMELVRFKRQAWREDRIFYVSVVALTVLLGYHMFVIFRQGSTPEAVANSQNILSLVTTTALGFIGGQNLTGAKNPGTATPNDN